MKNPFYDETYKTNELQKIKEYIEKYKNEYKDTGELKFIAHNLNYLNSKQQKSRKIAISIIIGWLLLLFIIANTLIYKELIVPYNLNISLIEYILIVSGFVLLLLFFIYLSIKRLKRIDSIVMNDKSLILTLLNNVTLKSKKENSIIRYNLKDIYFDMKRDRNGHDNPTHNAFDIYITYNNKKIVYLLDAEYKREEFFVFMLFVEAIFNKLDVECLLDEELYEMFHSHKYGLKLKTDI